MRYLLAFWLTIVSVSLYAQDPLWTRYPAISPDGNWIVFSYKGDLYKVTSSGGNAVPLTMHEAYDYMPVWSNDGQSIAFASDRYGNFDIYIMSAQGGAPERITYHSSNDYPSDFSQDNKNVLFTSLRTDIHSSQMFPYGRLPELYLAPVEGGRIQQVTSIAAEQARYSSTDDKIVYHDVKGYEDPFRKHHTSSVTRDLWIYDKAANKYIQLTDVPGEDRDPVFSADDSKIYFLSGRGEGSSNIYEMDINGENVRQLTSYTKHPVRSLSISNDGKLSFHYDGRIYTLEPGGEPAPVTMQIFADKTVNTQKIVPIKGGADEISVSPNGKEIAFIFRGEVFVTSTETGTTKRITNTPEQERSVDFAPDGKSLVYAGERNGSWNIYQARLAREEEPYFFMSTLIDEVPLVVTDKETFQPSFSPDGKEVAFLEQRTSLRVINLDSKEVRTVVPGDLNYSYSDGDQYYQWSPDSKWFLFEFLPPNQWISEVGLIAADGKGEVINLTKSGYNDGRPKWAMDGKMMLWFSDKEGMRSHGSWGSQYDAYAMFFTRDAYNQFNMTEEEYRIWKEHQDKNKKPDEPEDKKKKKKNEDDDKKDKVEPVKFDWDYIEDREEKLTIHSSALGDALLSNDGEHLYYLSRFEGGFDLWQTNLRTKETKILAKLNARNVAGVDFDKEGENLFVLSGGNILKVALKDGSKKSVPINGEMVLNELAEKAYMFEHMWRQVREKFYVKDLHDVDWDYYKKEYAKFLPHINNNYDFSEMMSELLGELNASHTGCRYRPNQSEGAETASLGAYYDPNFTGNGLKIAKLMPRSPLFAAEEPIEEGMIIEKIDGVTITPDMNYYPLLNRKEGKYTLMSIYDPSTEKRWEATVKPIGFGDEFNLRYEQWVDESREIVDKASNGRIGYVHVRGMNTASFHTVFEEVLGINANKDALVVDTRFNGGGWLHDDLATFLSGKPYFKFRPRGQNLGSEPQFKWTKPSAVVMGEGNYSDAHMFPYAYKTLDIGPLVGMPVPGTGTAVWWERLQDPTLVFGIPQVGVLTPDNKYMENMQLEPDVKVMNEPKPVLNGRDMQLEAAVEVLLNEVGQE